MKDLKGYTGFLFNDRLEELTRENLRILKTHSLPLMKFFAHLDEEELYHLTKASVSKFLRALHEGAAHEDAKLHLKLWENEELHGPTRGEIRPSDLALGYTIRKQGLLKFLPDYTTNVHEVVNIMKELEDHFILVQDEAIAMLFNMEHQGDEKEAIYRDLFENATDLIHIASVEGDLLYANTAWLNATGYLKEELSQLNYKKLVHPDYIELYTRERERAIAGEAGSEINIAFLSKSGKTLFLKGNISCHFINGTPSSTRGVFTDITLKNETEDRLKLSTQELKESEQQIQTIFQNAPDAVILIDDKGKVIKWNPRAEEIFGWSAKEIIGNYLPDFIISMEFREDPRKGIRQFLNAGDGPLLNRTLEREVLNKQGHLFIIELSVSPTQVRDKHLFVVFVRDVTESKKAIENLRLSEERYHLLVNEVVDYAIIRLDQNGNITTWNKGAERIKGYSASEIIGENISIFYSEEEREKNEPQNNLNLAREFGRYEKEGYRLRKDGSKFWANIIYTVLYDSDGKLSGFVKVARDFSERKRSDEQIAKSMKQLSEAQQMAHIGSWEWDMQTNIFSCSDELYRIYGLLPQQFEVSFETYLGYIHIEDRERVNEIIKKAVRDKKPFQFDHRIINQKGEERSLNSHGIIIGDKEGKSLIISGTTQDITELSHVMAELRRAEDTVKSKQQFLSNMSHEIRTPMNAIIGFTKVVLKTELNARQQEYLDAIKISGETLLVLINDILDLAKVDEGKMVFENIPFKLHSSFTAMIHLFEARMQEKNLNLGKLYDPNIPKVLMGDPVRLHQILLNLLSNALKFTKKGHIIVSLRLLNEEESNVTIEFSISDSGIGISPEHLDAIFENFHQASTSTARLYGGTGLGLAIVKQLVEKQGGSIKVKSTIGKGATFTFCLPFKKATKEQELKLLEHEHQEYEKGLSLNNVKVLVVEDIPLNQLLMKTLLNDFGCVYEIAENGRIAIRKMQENNYDIVLMDLQMPEMNGFEATEHIRNKMESKTPIIALTADVTSVDLEKCKAVGMNDYIAKPIDERILYNKIIKALKRSNNVKLNFERKVIPEQKNESKVTNIDNLRARTKKNPVLLMEMLRLFLEQTPVIINNMKEGVRSADWETIQSTAHKLIPSFSIVGVSHEYENMAKMVQDYASRGVGIETIKELVKKIEAVCRKACQELEEEVNVLEVRAEVKN